MRRLPEGDPFSLGRGVGGPITEGMKISAQHTGLARALELNGGAARTLPRPAGTEDVRGSGAVERTREGDAPDDGTAERIEAFTERIQARLEAFAEQSGLDLSEVEAAFAEHVSRLENALADGSLSRGGLAQGVQNIVAHLRDGVAAVTGSDDGRGRAEGAGAADPQARVEALAGSVEERVLALAEELGGDAGAGLEQALAAFGENVDRLLSGIADGSLEAQGIRNGLEGALDLVRQDVGRSLAAAGDDGQGGQDAATRFDAFVSGLEERLAGLGADLDSDAARELDQLHASFSSAMERLGSAAFEQGSIGRDSFQELAHGLLQDLKEDVKGLLGQDLGEAAGASLYHPVTGVEQLGGGLPGSLDTTV